jgi:biopolymer transport protein ExbD
MKFKKRLLVEAGLRQFDIAPLIDCVFILLIFFMLTSNFVVMPGINIRLPKTITSEQLNAQTLTIIVSSEDIIYFEGKPITTQELDKVIKKNRYNSIFIRADRDASLGAIVEVWDICKRRGIEKIGIATTSAE